MTAFNDGKKYGNRLQDILKYRIVLVVMKLKQIIAMRYAMIALIGGVISTPLLAPSVVFAGNTCGGADTSIITCKETDSDEVKDNGIWALLLMVLNILTAGVGIVAVAGIVYGSILYTTAENKADQVKKATDVITNVVIGLVLFALMWSGLNFIVPGGVFA